jgi:hypothetical protein
VQPDGAQFNHMLAQLMMISIPKEAKELTIENLPEGRGFDGLKSTEDVLLVVALYNPGDRDVDPATPDCRANERFACSGLENVTGSYDILCSSCVSGPRSTTNQDPPCLGEYFVRACHPFVKQHLDTGAR